MDINANIKYQEYFGLNDLGRQTMLQSIIEEGNKDKGKFIEFFETLDYGADSNRVIFYEAIWKKAKGWETFLSKELEWIVTKAEQGDEKAIEELSSVFILSLGKTSMMTSTKKQRDI